MFWSTDFNPSPSSIDLILRRRRIKLSDVLYNDDLLQELKVSNSGLIDFLSKKKVISELLNNITLLTEKDCCVKLSYSRVHAAYISCEILASGSRVITNALLSYPDALNKIISCLITEPEQSSDNEADSVEIINYDEDEQECDEHQSNNNNNNSNNNSPPITITQEEINANAGDEQQENNHNNNEKVENIENGVQQQKNTDNNHGHKHDEHDGMEELQVQQEEQEQKKQKEQEEQPKEQNNINGSHKQDETKKVESEQQNDVTNNHKEDEHVEEEEKHQQNSSNINSTNNNCKKDESDADAEQLQQPINQDTEKPAEEAENHQEQQPNNINSNNNHEEDEPDEYSSQQEQQNNDIKKDHDDDNGQPSPSEDQINENKQHVRIVPQKAALVSRLISTLHSLATSNLSCYISQDIETFSRLISSLIHNIDISGCFEILSTFVSSTTPPEMRFVFCEILSKLNFVHSLIDVMTLSEVEDKQRNACQLLCDIIVTSRQEAFEAYQDVGLVPESKAFDMLTLMLESRESIHRILSQMFQSDAKNLTAIVCGIKVLQTLVEQKCSNRANITNNVQLSFRARVIEQIQDDIVEYLIKFHELLSNPPKQEPIKTTFGVIQKPLGYVRLEVVSLIRALIGTNSSKIINKLVELQTMPVILDLFIEYSWNNLLHTQVEQALCLIIRNCRLDEESSYQLDMQNQNHSNIYLLAQLLNEYGLIKKLLKQPELCGQANFGHIIQIINSIAINCDLDAIRDHLNDMKENNPALYDRWTTFVNVDVASFKEISLYYDAQSANNRVGDRVANNHRLLSNTSPAQNANASGNESTDHFYTYFSFTSETVLPAINADVLPKVRRSKNVH